MKKMTKIILALLLTSLLVVISGCHVKENNEPETYKNKSDLENNIRNKKKTTKNGQEMDEYEMKDGTKIEAPSRDESSESE